MKHNADSFYHSMDRRKDPGRIVSKEKLVAWISDCLRQRKSMEKGIKRDLRQGGGKGNTEKRIQKMSALTKQIDRLNRIYFERFGDEDTGIST